MHAVVEIMGRRTRAGMVSDAQLGGATLLRIEHPSAADYTGDEPLCEYYAPQAIFAIRPCSPEQATQVATWAWRIETPRELSSVFADQVDDDEDDDEPYEWD